MKMYLEVLDAIPLLIGDRDNDRAELIRAMEYYERHGFHEKVKEIEDILKYKY